VMRGFVRRRRGNAARPTSRSLFLQAGEPGCWLDHMASSFIMAPIRVVCALIEREGCVLLARRPAHKHLGGKWEFPGGKIEAGETPQAALARECAEELACAVEVGAALPAVTHAYPDRTIVLMPFVCRMAVNSAEPRAAEHSALAWVEAERMSDYDLPEADAPIVAAYLAWKAARNRGV
jgi:8-oxo-dGTP diphosphatase